MPKSKEQRQAEAQERLLAAIPAARAKMMEYQPGSEKYKAEVISSGIADANATAAQAISAFRTKCREAGVDIHGNKL